MIPAGNGQRHQGRWRSSALRAAVSIAVALVVQSPSGQAARGADRTARDVIEDFIEASGGHRAFSHQRIYMRQRLAGRTPIFDHQTNYGLLELWISPLGYRINMWSAIYRSTQICDLRRCVGIDFSGENAISAEQARQGPLELLLDLPARGAARARLVPPIDAPPGPLEAEAAGSFECVEFSRADAEPHPGPQTYVDCFDQHTHLRRFRQSTASGGISRTTFSDYRWVHGMRLPYVQRSPGGTDYETVEILTLEIDLAMAPELFRPASAHKSR
jgi:hypothetical protein